MKKICIYLNEYQESIEVANELEERFNNVEIETDFISIHEERNDRSDYDFNIVIGGDGSFLKAVMLSNYSKAPFIGINTGGLGFFQEVGLEDIPNLVHHIKTGDYVTDPIRLLKCTAFKTDGSSREFLCVNEALVKGLNSKVLHMDVMIGDNFLERFSGDGLIISTSIGSTAYNFSVGGAIVYPALEIMQLSPLAPISSASYRSLLNSVIMPGRLVVTMKPETKYEKGILIVQDGTEHLVENIDRIETTMSNVFINRLHIDDNSYWINLREKFIW